jgi:hypothetical protein
MLRIEVIKWQHKIKANSGRQNKGALEAGQYTCMSNVKFLCNLRQN